MLRPLTAPTRVLPTVLALAAGATLLAACGGDESPEDAGEAPVSPPAAGEFPKPTGTLDDLIAEVGQTDQIVASQSGAVFEPGDKRFGFGLFDVGGRPESIGELEVGEVVLVATGLVDSGG